MATPPGDNYRWESQPPPPQVQSAVVDTGGDAATQPWGVRRIGSADVHVRGWVECGPDQFEQVEAILAAHDDGHYADDWGSRGGG